MTEERAHRTVPFAFLLASRGRCPAVYSLTDLALAAVVWDLDLVVDLARAARPDMVANGPASVAALRAMLEPRGLYEAASLLERLYGGAQSDRSTGKRSRGAVGGGCRLS